MSDAVSITPVATDCDDYATLRLDFSVTAIGEHHPTLEVDIETSADGTSYRVIRTLFAAAVGSERVIITDHDRYVRCKSREIARASLAGANEPLPTGLVWTLTGTAVPAA
jgi:hypothetical protein